MAQYKKNQQPTTSAETVQEAEALAKATQRPGQTKEQTKLVAQGVQKGIELYKKQQKAKARELDKKLKQVRNLNNPQQPINSDEATDERPFTPPRSQLLPWVLLGLSWIGFIIFFTFYR